MFKFTHIEAFHQVMRNVATLNELEEVSDAKRVLTPVRFRGTVKLHGSNAGVTCSPQGLIPQSRNRELSIGAGDNLAFAAFVSGEAQTRAIREMEAEARSAAGIDGDLPLVFYGEWVGPGVQRGVATNHLPQRQWVLFAVATVDAGEKTYLDVVPRLDERFAEEQIYSVLDVEAWELEVDFADRASMESAFERSEQWVAEVEAACPWGRRFDVEGVGEGIVWIPTGEHWGKSHLYWKAKGSAHKNVKRLKGQASIDPEVAESIEQFVEMCVTEPRLEQGLEYLREMGLPLEMRSTGDFMKWVGQDVKRECAVELDQSQLKWTQVGKAVNARALAFFKEKVISF